jgi:bifunctional non-homologous end joining protein LigD
VLDAYAPQHRQRSRGAGHGPLYRFLCSAERVEGTVDQDRHGAFDLFYLNGNDLRKLPLNERKAQLRKIIQHTDVQFSDSFEIDGAEMLAHACKVGLEGVVSKVRDSSYISGRGNDWVKSTCAQRETLTIAGFALDGSDWDGIYLGPQRRCSHLRRQGRPRLYESLCDRFTQAADAADPQDATLRKEDRSQSHLGRAAVDG